MEEVRPGGAVTPRQAIGFVDEGRFPPGEPIAFPDRIIEPPDRPPTNFFDPLIPNRPPDIELQRRLQQVPPLGPDASTLRRVRAWFTRAVTGDVREEFQLGERVAYVDKEHGVVMVPSDLERFRTDLTSVPRFFTWLVPKTGQHLPAALIHDGLVHADQEPQSYIAAATIDREQADRIFRDAMGDLGTPLLRRWLIWTTVLLATLTVSAQRLRWIVTIALTLLVVLALGVLATIDLVDYRAPLPWMGERPWYVEVGLGLLFAVLVPAVLCLTWGSRWLPGVMMSIAVALLFHVTILIAISYSLIGALEGAVDRDWRKIVTYSTAIGVLGGVTLGILALVRSIG